MRIVASKCRFEKRELFQLHHHVDAATGQKYFTWELLKLKLQLEKFLLLRGKEKPTYCHHTVLQVRQESGCSVYCYGIRLSEERHDTVDWHWCPHMGVRQMMPRTGARTASPQYGWGEDDCSTASPLLLFDLLSSSGTSPLGNLAIGEAKRNKICHRYKIENLYTNKDSGLCSVILGSWWHPCCRLGGFHLLLERLKGPSHPST